FHLHVRATPAIYTLSLHDALPILAEEHEVVRATGLRPQSDRGLLPTAEGLTTHDRTGDTAVHVGVADLDAIEPGGDLLGVEGMEDRKSTRLNSSHVKISYAVFCLK